MLFNRLRFFIVLCLVVSSVDAYDYLFRNPYGARSLGMGGAGYALADDESALWYNPAGLGIENQRWSGGAVSASRESYLGSLVRPNFTLTYQNANLKNIGLSTNLYRSGTGRLTETDSSWREIRTVYPYQMIAGLGGGYTLFTNDIMSHSLGIAFKYYTIVDYFFDTQIHSSGTSGELNAVISNLVEYREHAVSFDGGYLLKLFDRLRIGIAVKNVGPDVRIEIDDTAFFRTRQSRIVAIGAGYKDSFGTKTMTILDLAMELSYSRTKAAFDIENAFHTGIEFLFLRTVPLRLGYIFQQRPMREYLADGEIPNNGKQWFTFGAGFRMFNHIDGDVGWVIPFYNDGNIRTIFSLSYTRALIWTARDLKWWRRGKLVE